MTEVLEYLIYPILISMPLTAIALPLAGVVFKTDFSFRKGNYHYWLLAYLGCYFIISIVNVYVRLSVL